MTYDDISKKIMLGEKIYNLPLRVCFYARVSTDSDVQLNSLDNQLDYYEKYIKSKEKWIFAGGYVEEGVSGVRVDKRTSFKKMIRDSKQNKFDLIITKEVSRFARDLEDSIHYIRELKEANVGVFFENQNLNTFDPNSELILNIMFNLAQDESRKLSARVKFGHRQAIEKGHVLGSSNIIGYKKVNCKLVIVSEEAKFVKTLFLLYATGEYGFLKLAKKLDSLGYRNKKGKLYDKDTLKRIIENPKYKGYYRARVHEIIDYRTKKRKNNKIEDQVIYKCVDGSIPAIVSEELWNKANEILKARTIKYQSNNYWSGGLKYPFSSKLYCKYCNTRFQRSHGSKRKNRPIWCCGNYLQNQIKACASPIIAELDLYNIFDSIMKKIIHNKEDIIGSLCKLYEDIDKTNDYDNELKLVEEKIKKIEEKKSFALELAFNGQLDKELLRFQFEELEKEIKKLNFQKNELYKQIELINNSNDLNKFIKEEINGGFIDKFIRKFVSKIMVSKIDNDRYNIKLDIFLNLFGEERDNGLSNFENSNILTYLENMQCSTLENKRANQKENKFIYNVYIVNF